MAYYYNQAGYRGPLPERALEPTDCWGETVEDKEDENDFIRD